MTASERNAGNPRALVTGASSGIGAAFAERLAREGFDLIVVARRHQRLTTLALALQEKYGRQVEVLRADLTQTDDLRKVEERVASDPALEMVVNNAGFADATPFSQVDPDIIEAMIQVQVVALVRLTRAVLPGMIARGHGAIVNLSSIAAFAPHPDPTLAIYCATKAFINTFTQGIQDDIRGTGVQVQALCPAFVPTEFFDRAGFDSQRLDSLWMRAETLVDACLTGLQLGEVICFPSLADPSLLREVNVARETVWERAATNTLAQRYIR